MVKILRKKKTTGGEHLKHIFPLGLTKRTVSAGAQLWGEGGRPPLRFFENQKKCPDFGKK